MPKLIPDYGDLEDDNSEVGDFFREFLDSEGDRLVEDLGDDAFTMTFMCTMLEGLLRELRQSSTTPEHHAI